MHHTRTCTLLLGLLLGWMTVNAQVKDRPSILDRGLEQFLTPGQQAKEDFSEKVRGIPMEGAIDINKYVVGPSDVLQLGIWGPITLSYTLTVTPEGTLIIPTVGEVKVADEILAAVKNKVKEIVKKKYLVGNISLTLLRPRSFVVTLRGAVLKQGQYLSSPVDRVEKILLQGASIEAPRSSVNISTGAILEGGLSSQGTSAKGGDYLRLPRVAQEDEIYDRASTRNILLVRRGGDTMRVDIPKYYSTGDDRYNPFLLDGDVIFVPQRNLSRNFITVEGAVNAPGRYEFVQGDGLLSVIGVAQGFRTGVDIDYATISRPDDTGEHFEVIKIQVHAGSTSGLEDVLLRRGDRVVVQAKVDERKNYGVTVSGEVRSPGIYPVTRSSTRLSEVIRNVGGFTDRALLSGSIILRKQDRPDGVVDPQLSLLRSLRSSDATPADSALFSLDIRLGRHPVVVDFKRLFEQKDSTEDIVLQNEDVIYIASDQRTVLVQGQVANPGHVSFVPGMPYDYYVEKAGGYSELAIEGDTRVIKKATLEWVEPGKTTVDPGDQIWVPKRGRRDFRYYFDLVKDILSVTAGISTTIILAIQVFK